MQFWMYQMPIQGTKPTVTSYFHKVTGLGHVDMPQNVEADEEMMRGESGLLSAMEEPGSSSLFHNAQQRESGF
ncbi:MAG: hypothetical protein ACKO96_03155 [Flammeovirgaceae bacterium]